MIDSTLTDTYGYLCNAYFSVGTIDGEQRFIDAALAPLRSLPSGYDDPWPNDMDAYADGIEGALNLLREFESDGRKDAIRNWIDANTARMWALQKPDGFIESWYGDGNFARTAIMYALSSHGC